VPVTKTEPAVEISARCSKCGKRFFSEVCESHLTDERVHVLLGMAKVTVTVPARRGGMVDETSGSFFLCGDCLDEMLSNLGLDLENVLQVPITDIT